MVTDFNKNSIVTNGGIKPATKNTPADVRTRIETIGDVESIPLPYVGMIFYVIDEEEYYKVLSLKGSSVVGAEQPDTIVDRYEKLIDFTGLATEEFVTQAIGEIELTPGPQGEQGPKGDKGAKGAIGYPGMDGSEIEFRKGSNAIEWRYSKERTSVADFNVQKTVMTVNGDNVLTKIDLANIPSDIQYVQIKTVTVFGADAKGNELVNSNPSITTAPSGTKFEYFGGFDPTLGKIDISGNKAIVGDALIQNIVNSELPSLKAYNDKVTKITRIRFWVYLIDSEGRDSKMTFVDCYINSHDVVTNTKLAKVVEEDGWKELVTYSELLAGSPIANELSELKQRLLDLTFGVDYEWKYELKQTGIDGTLNFNPSNAPKFFEEVHALEEGSPEEEEWWTKFYEEDIFRLYAIRVASEPVGFNRYKTLIPLEDNATQTLGEEMADWSAVNGVQTWNFDGNDENGFTLNAPATSPMVYVLMKIKK